MKRYTLILISIISLFIESAFAQEIFSLDSCHNMALENDKDIEIARQHIALARYEKRSARSNFLPSFDASGGYIYNSRDLQLLSNQQLSNLSTNLDNLSTVIGTLTAVTDPSLLPLLEGLAPLGDKIKDGVVWDIHNVWVGAVTFKQPIYMGGKIAAYYKLAKLSEKLAESKYETDKTNLLVSVDKAYWQIISLAYKKRLAQSYVDMISNLRKDVQEMYDVGVATKSDLLTVSVRLNEAEMMLLKVNDGLVLSKMVLARLCGLPLEMDYTLIDEKVSPSANGRFIMPDFANGAYCQDLLNIDQYNMRDVFDRRSELQSLRLATDIYKKKSVIERAAMLPQISVAGGYSMTNPNMFDGFQNNLKGMFSVGVMVTVPLWNWGRDYNKWKAARVEMFCANLKEIDAREQIHLQVSQAVFEMKESCKTLLTATSNMNKAEENLNNARIAYQEGMVTTQNVLEAQTAWLSAQSDIIDAEVDVRLSRVYLKKALGVSVY